MGRKVLDLTCETEGIKCASCAKPIRQGNPCVVAISYREPKDEYEELLKCQVLTDSELPWPHRKVIARDDAEPGAAIAVPSASEVYHPQGCGYSRKLSRDPLANRLPGSYGTGKRR